MAQVHIEKFEIGKTYRITIKDISAPIEEKQCDELEGTIIRHLEPHEDLGATFPEDAPDYKRFMEVKLLDGTTRQVFVPWITFAEEVV